MKGQMHAASPWTRFAFIAVTLLFLGVFLLVPLAVIFAEAFSAGVGAYWRAISDAYTLRAIGMTLMVTAIAVPLNLVFGLAAAWSIAKFEFRGKSLLITLIDLPFAVSPVISGLLFVLLFGRQGTFGPWLERHDLHVIFAWPGMVLATVFVTFPFVARELIPIMQEQGQEEELAAISLGASGWQTFWRVTMPNIKWALLYGTVLCTARAMGEYGAVTVVSANVFGQTNTLPLHIDALYQTNSAAAFAVATLLAVTGLVTLGIKSYLDRRIRQT